jgi:XapX domain-containing protein
VTRNADGPSHLGEPANSGTEPSGPDKGVAMATAWQFTISLGIGVLVGVGYGLLKVRSPAPPPVALVGLLGMLLGQQLTSWLHW